MGTFLKFAQLILMTLWLLGKSFVFAQTSQTHLLKDLQIKSFDQTERIILIFQKEFSDSPIIDFDPGLVYIRLNSTYTNNPAREFAPTKNSLIDKIYVNRNTNSVDLRIALQSRTLSLENRIKVTMDRTHLIIDLDRQESAVSRQRPSEKTTVGEQFAHEIGQRLRETSGDQLSNTLGTTPLLETNQETPFNLNEPSIAPKPDSWMMTLLTLIFSLLGILLFLMILLYLYNKLLSGRFPTIQGKFKIKVASTFHIGPRQKVIVLDVNGQHFACGVTSNSINFLTEINDKNDQSFLENVTSTGDKINFNADQTRANFLKTFEAARKKADKIENSQTPPSKIQESTPTQTDSLKSSSFETILQDQQGLESTPTKPQNSSTQPRKNKPTTNVKSTPKTTKMKTFNTPIRPPIEEPILEQKFSQDVTLQKFAKQLGQKLKSLKPLN